MFLKKRFAMRYSRVIIATYLERASAMLHDSVLANFLTVLFAAIPSPNPLLLSSGAELGVKKTFAFCAERSGYYYKREEYKNA